MDSLFGVAVEPEKRSDLLHGDGSGLSVRGNPTPCKKDAAIILLPVVQKPEAVVLSGISRHRERNRGLRIGGVRLNHWTGVDPGSERNGSLKLIGMPGDGIESEVQLRAGRS